MGAQKDTAAAGSTQSALAGSEGRMGEDARPAPVSIPVCWVLTLRRALTEAPQMLAVTHSLQ